MSDKDWNRLAAFEKAIAKKYGKETIQNPKSNWDEDKERDYVEQQKKLYQKEIIRKESTEKIEHDGILISKKLLNRESKRSCPVCAKLFFRSMDDVTMTKYDCCFACYVEYVENREERWLKGWRPNEDNKSTD
tara:strand:- start:19946 stop:20344 length:399 start_codon:yes stop_codon:yes gene_type:complete